MIPYRIGICPKCGRIGTLTRHYSTKMIPGDGWLVIHIDGDNVSWCFFEFRPYNFGCEEIGCLPYREHNAEEEKGE